MREYFPELAGNLALCERLGDELSRGAISHAYILCGPHGSGKHTLARAIAMSLACERRSDGTAPLPCGTCATCRKILAGNCPDILTVSREEDKATMGVDVVRNLRADIATLPNDLDLKIYVIEDAHTMTTQAQNALLLTLEEPPPFVLFLLLCEDPDALLETIRSRAPLLRMQNIGESELQEYLLSPARPAIARTAKALLAEDPAQFSALLRMAGGRIGRALELLEEKKRAPLLAHRADAEALLSLLAEGGKSHELLPLLLSFGEKREEVTLHLFAVKEALRDLILLDRSDEAPLTFFTDRERAIDLSAHFTAHKLFSLTASTDAALQALAVNANVRLTLIHYLCRITAQTP